jgi:hypothetical protein
VGEVLTGVRKKRLCLNCTGTQAWHTGPGRGFTTCTCDEPTCGCTAAYLGAGRAEPPGASREPAPREPAGTLNDFLVVLAGAAVFGTFIYGMVVHGGNPIDAALFVLSIAAEVVIGLWLFAWLGGFGVLAALALVAALIGFVALVALALIVIPISLARDHFGTSDRAAAKTRRLQGVELSAQHREEPPGE